MEIRQPWKDNFWLNITGVHKKYIRRIGEPFVWKVDRDSTNFSSLFALELVNESRKIKLYTLQFDLDYGNSTIIIERLKNYNQDQDTYLSSSVTLSQAVSVSHPVHGLSICSSRSRTWNRNSQITCS